MRKNFTGATGGYSIEIQRQGTGYYCLIGGDDQADQPVPVDHFEIVEPGVFRITLPDGTRRRGRYHIEDQTYFLHIDGRTYRFEEARQDAGAGSAGGEHRTPMPGKVLAVEVAVGDTVEKDQTLLIVEAMKMENAVKAAFAGAVKAVSCGVGDLVSPEDVLVELEAAE